MDELQVEEVYAGEEDGVFAVAFRGPDGGEVVIFQLADQLGRQDAMLGMDTYSISTAAGATAYGGVVGVTASDAQLLMVLREDVAALLGLSSTVVLKLPDGGDARLRECSWMTPEEVRLSFAEADEFSVVCKSLLRARP